MEPRLRGERPGRQTLERGRPESDGRTEEGSRCDPRQRPKKRPDVPEDGHPQLARTSSGKNTGRLGYSCNAVGECAAEAIFYCPTMNSHRPKSQVTSKEQALIPEKESRRTWPRCHVSLEKSSRNHKPLEKWAKPNLSPDVAPCPANFYGEYFPRICHVVKPNSPELSAVLTRYSGWQK